jgi:DNA-binding transcriptional regulator YdaS (Cro superfamily)
MPMEQDADLICQQILETRGLPSRIAVACGITRQSVYQWRKVPADRVHVVAKIMKLSPKKIRPDVFK